MGEHTIIPNNEGDMSSHADVLVHIQIHCRTCYRGPSWFGKVAIPTISSFGHFKFVVLVAAAVHVHGKPLVPAPVAALLADMFDQVELAAVSLADQDTPADTMARVEQADRAGTMAGLADRQLAKPGCAYW